MGSRGFRKVVANGFPRRATAAVTGLLILGPLLCGGSLADSGPVTGFTEAVRRAVVDNPRVNAGWYELEASREAQRVARGSYYPSVDLTSIIGREERDTPLVSRGSYTPDATRFTITQMLFDGFATRNEVARLGYAKLSRYYEFRQISEQVALEAALAYLDTVRYQRLVELAEDNYVMHREIYDKIGQRTRAGVSQGVDLEQAASRVALAESNLLTEMTNLHDVRARLQRIVGAGPADDLALPTLPAGLIPERRSAALNLAYERSPRVNAAIENLHAARAAVKGTNAPMMPKLDLRYRNEVEHDTDGIDGRFDEEAIELVFTYNLFRGGSDSARKRQFHHRYNAAIEERKQACINTRQDLMIAYNNIAALQEQLQYLQQSRLAQNKTRKAYSDQFDIGQRTLLDLLDSQNEYFDTERAYTEARIDLRAAQARTLANMGLLLAALEVESLNADQLAEIESRLGSSGNDEKAHLCPAEPPEPVVVDKQALYRDRQR